jgi:hypothetical protein
VNAEEAAVNEGSDREGAEGSEACVVHARRVLVQAFAFEGEILCELLTLVVPSQKGDFVWEPELESV